MPPVRFQRVRRRAVQALGVAALLGAVAVAAFLPFAGRYLVSEDAIEPADVIFVLAGTRVERWMEAKDLYDAGVAPRILLSPGRPEAAEARLRAEGVPFPSDAELARSALLHLGVPAEAVEMLPTHVDNTAQEAAALRARLDAARWRRVVVVTSKYHTRRVRYAFAREFGESAVEIRIRASRHDTANPERWWTRREDVRFIASELPKLVAYRLGLGG